jgi:hypothetical protein
MGIFANIKGAKGTEGGNYFVPGNYVVRIERCKQDKTRMNKDFFAAECRILASDTEDLKVGSTASFFVLFDEYPELSLGNVADFMNAAMKSYFAQNSMQMPEGFEVDEEVADEISGEENILAGTLIAVEAFNKKTRADTDFTRFKWTPMTKAEMAKYADAA